MAENHPKFAKIVAKISCSNCSYDSVASLLILPKFLNELILDCRTSTDFILMSTAVNECGRIKDSWVKRSMCVQNLLLRVEFISSLFSADFLTYFPSRFVFAFISCSWSLRCAIISVISWISCSFSLRVVANSRVNCRKSRLACASDCCAALYLPFRSSSSSTERTRESNFPQSLISSRHKRKVSSAN